MQLWLWNIPQELTHFIFQLSVADLALMHFMTNMPAMNAEFGALIENYPSVNKHAEKIQALPKIAKWIANRPDSTV